MSLRPKTYKTSKGSIEVYGGFKDDFYYYPSDKAKEIGIYVTRLSPDYSEHHIDEGASVHLTPKKAREVAQRMLEWADAIESKEK